MTVPIPLIFSIYLWMKGMVMLREMSSVWPFLAYGSASLSFLNMAVLPFPFLLWQCFHLLLYYGSASISFSVMAVLPSPSLLWQCFVLFYIPKVPLQNHHDIPPRLWRRGLINCPFSSPIPFPIMSLITHLVLTRDLRHKWL